MYVVAEGVETPEQLAQLQKLDNGKELAQVYLFSKLLASEAVEPTNIKAARSRSIVANLLFALELCENSRKNVQGST